MAVGSPAALASFIGSAVLTCCGMIIKTSTTIEEHGGNFTMVAMFTLYCAYFYFGMLYYAVDVLNSRFSLFSVNLKYCLPYYT